MGKLKDKAAEYTALFKSAEILSDTLNRSRKAEKIKAVLNEEGMYEKDGIQILDVGCSHGKILVGLKRDSDHCVGIDYDEYSERNMMPGLNFIRGDAEKLPLRSEVFDIVICNHVYEHTDSPEEMLDEIYRVMKNEGVCYFTGPNKYDLVEPHYKLPLLSWFPERLANFYIRYAGKDSGYYIKPYSLSRVRKMLKKFDVSDYTGKIIRDPEKYMALDMLKPGSIRQRIAIMVSKYLPFLFPGFVYILRKKS